MDITREDWKQQRQRRRWRYTAGVVTVVVALVIGTLVLEPAAPSVLRSMLYIGTVERGEMLLRVRGPGVLVPRETLWIAAASEARVDRVLAKPGAAVEADTVLVEMSNPELVQQVSEVRAQLEAAQAEYAALEVQLQSEVLNQRAVVAAARAEYEGTRLEAEARRELAERGIIPAIDYRRIELAAEQFKVRLDVESERVRYLRYSVDARLRAARARIEQRRQNLALREAQLANLDVRAGVAGVLQSLEAEAGQRLAPGANIARIAQPDELMAELRIPETQATDIRLEQAVEIDTRNGVVDGRVVRIDPAVRNGTVQVDVAIDGELPDGTRPDLSVDGTILIARLQDVLHVNRPVYGQPGSTIRLFRVEPDSGVAVRVPVTLGRASVDRVQVVTGLNQGDRIILSDTSEWDDFDRIELN